MTTGKQKKRERERKREREMGLDIPFKGIPYPQ
jgi:hypothetical protein